MHDSDAQSNAHEHIHSHSAGESSRIGELLSRIIPLSAHDVEEILHEQSSASHQRFGDIALQLGLATPAHVLKAWLAQLETRTERVSLDRFGVDTQALTHLDPCTVRTHRALPIRAIEEFVVVAVASWPDAQTIGTLERAAGAKIRPVLTDENELNRAIERFYPAANANHAQPHAACA